MSRIEPNEDFFVNLSNASGGFTIADAQGLGTITNDKHAAVADVRVREDGEHSPR